MLVADGHGHRQDFLHFEYLIDEVPLLAHMRDMAPHGRRVEPGIVPAETILVGLVNPLDLVIVQAAQQRNRATAYIQRAVPAYVGHERLDGIRAFRARRTDAIETGAYGQEHGVARRFGHALQIRAAYIP
ncbi:hypothetical protein D3C72_1705150 [compost metagenome]